MEDNLCVLGADLVQFILLSLPPKSVLMFKCTCKRWYGFVSDPTFQHSYNLKMINSCFPAGIFTQQIFHCCHNALLFPLYSSTNRKLSTNTLLDFLPETTALVGSSNGILCCRSCKVISYHMSQSCGGIFSSKPVVFPVVFYICNPATREWISLRLPQRFKLGRAFAFAFAFDPRELSFTLVGIQFSLDKPDFCSFVIYNSKLKTWRVSREFMCFASWIRPESYALVSDRCHWITCKQSICKVRFGVDYVCEGFYMVVFDIRKELCQVIKLPHITSDENSVNRRCCLGEYNGRIHYVCAYKYEVKIWQLKDYNEPPHWVPAAFRFPCLADYMEKHCRNTTDHFVGQNYPRDGDNKDRVSTYVKPLFLYNDVLFISMPGTLCTYNFRSGEQVRDIGRIRQFYLGRMCLVYNPTIYTLKMLDARGSPVDDARGSPIEVCYSCTRTRRRKKSILPPKQSPLL